LIGTDELPIPVKGCEMLLLLQMALSLVSIARCRKYQMVNCGLMGAFNYAHLHELAIMLPRKEVDAASEPFSQAPPVSALGRSPSPQCLERVE
jgi:hypothetical protein